MPAESNANSSAAAEAITALHRRSLENARPQGRAVLGGRVTLQSLMDLSRAGDLAKTELVSRVSDSDHVVEILEELMTVVTREVLNLLPGGPFPTRYMQAGMDGDMDLMSRVSSRTIYTAATGNDAENFAILEAYEAAGAEVRIADDLPHRLVIFDRMCAVLPVKADDLTKGALIVREPAMVLSLFSLYSSIWRRATPLSTFGARKVEAPSESDRQVLVMMSTGITDEVACARLGVSLRTYRRQIANVLQKLDAKTRFQAGTRAVERGWL